MTSEVNTPIGPSRTAGQVRPPCRASEPTATAVTTARNEGHSAARSAGTVSRAAPAAPQTSAHGRGRLPARRPAVYTASVAGTATTRMFTASPSPSSSMLRTPVARAAHRVVVRMGAGSPGLRSIALRPCGGAGVRIRADVPALSGGAAAPGLAGAEPLSPLSARALGAGPSGSGTAGTDGVSDMGPPPPTGPIAPAGGAWPRREPRGRYLVAATCHDQQTAWRTGYAAGARPRPTGERTVARL